MKEIIISVNSVPANKVGYITHKKVKVGQLYFGRNIRSIRKVISKGINESGDYDYSVNWQFSWDNQKFQNFKKVY